MIAEHDVERIKLKAFEHFFSTRSLTDEVTIWQFEEELAKVTNFDQSEIQVASRGRRVVFSSVRARCDGKRDR